MSRRAFKLYRARGSEPGTELKDWKAAERDLLSQIPVDIADVAGNLYAFASVPGYGAAEISVAIEDHWMLISGYGNTDSKISSTAEETSSSDGVSTAERREEVAARDRETRAGFRADNSRFQRDADESFQDCAVRRPFCVIDLCVQVDPTHSAAVLSDGLLAIRMAKVAIKSKPH